jgi:nitrate reductase alpha subunit
MKKIFGFLFVVFFFQSCWIGCSGCNNSTSFFESMTDHWNYESLTNATGTVIAKVGDSTFSYPHAKIIYSETDVATLLIEDNAPK